MKKVILIGPESSGKSTLCQQLGEHFQTPYTTEFARAYLTQLDQAYTEEDLLEIAKGQLASEQVEGELLFCDTDLLTIKIWSDYKYGQTHPWIIDQIAQQQQEDRFYLVCKPDIPWTADPLREHPNNREELFDIHLKELQKLQLTYHIIDGEERLQKALSKIQLF